MSEITPELLKSVCYHLGTNSAVPEEAEYVSSLIRSAVDELQSKTGVDWLKTEPGTRNHDIALEAIRGMAYLSYYGNRGEEKNIEHLKKNIASKIFTLQYSKEAVQARRGSNGI